LTRRAAGLARGAPARGAPPGEVRLIGGTLRKSRLPVPDRPGLRPTPDRVRQTLFDWLGQDLSGWRVLDAFAGSGALGFEAASRGAAAVTLLERDRTLVDGLHASAVRLKVPQVQALGADALAWMAAAPLAAFELVLLDPPFDSGLLQRALPLAAPLLAPGGWLYAESPQALAPPPGLLAWRTLKAGAVHAQLWRRDGA
jgi:16S rRNA (guanine(966)-N(2))-methyltransferase RsmD